MFNVETVIVTAAATLIALVLVVRAVPSLKRTSAHHIVTSTHSVVAPVVANDPESGYSDVPDASSIIDRASAAARGRGRIRP